MRSPLRLLLPLALACLAGCPVWEPLASCADYDACGTTTAVSSSSEGTLPTTSPSGGTDRHRGERRRGLDLQHHTPNTITSKLHQLQVAAGLEKSGPHRLRHTA